jgi:hypothetical protein
MEAIRGRRSPRQGTDLPEVLGADFLDGRIDLGIEALWRLLKEGVSQLWICYAL